MLYCFYGNNDVDVHTAVRAFVDAEERTPEWITATDWYPKRIIEYADGISLFGETSLYILRTPSENADMCEEVFDSLETLAASPHTFVLVEGTLTPTQKKVIAKHAHSIEEFKKTAVRYNIFGLADILLRRDKRALWLEIARAYEAGESAEAIIGILFWQLKTLRLAQTTTSASEAGIKEFPYNKAKRALNAFPHDDVTCLMHDLILVYHEGHAGKNIQHALEEWVLRG